MKTEKKIIFENQKNTKSLMSHVIYYLLQIDFIKNPLIEELKEGWLCPKSISDTNVWQDAVVSFVKKTKELFIGLK